MAKYGKWIGGGLGWALGGPIGGILGFLFGSMFDSMQTAEFEWRPPIGDQSREAYGDQAYTRTQRGDFTVSLLVLAAAVMKADGRVVKSELEYVRQFLRSQFNEEMTSQSILMLREILKQDYNPADVARQVGRHMDSSSKLQLLHFLFGISMADGRSHPTEIEVIHEIAGYMGVRNQDYESIKSMFVKDNFSNYKILEITPDASNDELKKAYRKMAIKYHPDKVSHLGPDIQEAAKKKFQELNAAYDAIKKDRGIV